MKNLSLSALAAVGVLAGMTAANAADLGGNCCADLEERIAELEATTARKGNRKVSLTVSGWVSQQLSIWDDGVRTKAYVSDIGTTLATNVKFTGQAQINSDWSAGYVLHLEAIGSEPLAHDNSNVTAGSGVGVLQSFWFLKSNSLGKLSIGKQSSAADNVAILPDGSGSLIPANYVLFDNNAFGLRVSSVSISAGGAHISVGIPGKPIVNTLINGFIPNSGAPAFNWGQLATCPGIQLGVAADCDGVPNNNIRYDTPVFGGFSASASWGENDIWAVAGRYAGQLHDVKVSGAIAYTETTNTTYSDPDPSTVLGGALAGSGFAINGYRVRGGALQMGGYAEHVPTGLFIYGAYGKDFNTSMPPTLINQLAGGFATQPSKPDGENWYLKAGIRQKWSPLGATVLFGEYGENEDKQSVALYRLGITSTNVTQWGLGAVQEIDAAAMSMWFVYRNYSADASAHVDVAGFGPVDLKANFADWQVFKVGGLINF